MRPFFRSLAKAAPELPAIRQLNIGLRKGSKNTVHPASHLLEGFGGPDHKARQRHGAPSPSSERSIVKEICDIKGLESIRKLLQDLLPAALTGPASINQSMLSARSPVTVSRLYPAWPTSSHQRRNLILKDLDALVPHLTALH